MVKSLKEFDNGCVPMEELLRQVSRLWCSGLRVRVPRCQKLPM